ncbi:MAG: NADH-quinone oxidoreductase subunit N [Rhodobiaceae bacterium UBA7378]|nr:MAG: NADH-quinone oxidoreductase subunit N [Rhodobiaceae bacterium UBA7378]
MLANVILLLPELVLFLGAMGLLMLGAFAASDATRTVEFGAISLLLIAAVASWLQGEAGAQLAFSGSFIVDQFSAYMKTLTYLATAVIIIMSRGFMQNENLARFEVPVLMVLAAVGMGMMISANDLISLYMGIELQSLALYVLAAIKRDSLRATEAGLKYFVLGALSSGMLLYGASLIYGFSGTTNFTGIAAAFTTENGVLPLAQVVGMVFLLAGLAFKISAVPFHMWTPDVYEGAPTPMTAFFAAAPKLAGMAVFLRVVISAFPDALVAWQQIIIFISIASMVLGAFAAIGQTNIKRLMAYSSIGHMGFALVGFAAGSEDGVTAVILYMTLYGIMTLGAFACILSMRRDSGMVEQIKSLSGLSQVRPFMALCLAILMFSLAGIPPLAGFFGKLFVFHAAIDAGLYGLCVLGVLSSVVGAYYYLRIVKIMYLDPPADEANDPMPRELSIIAGLFAGVCLVFFVYPSPLIDLATNAGQALTAVPSPEAVLTGVFGAPEVR